MISHVETKLHGRANVWPLSQDSEIVQTQFYANSVGYHNFGQLAANGGPIVSQPPRIPTGASQLEFSDKWTDTRSQLS